MRAVRTSGSGGRCHGVAGQPYDPFLGVADADRRAVPASACTESAVAEDAQRHLARNGVQARHVGFGELPVAGEFGAPVVVLLQPSSALCGLRGEVAVVAVAVAGDLGGVDLQDGGGEAFEELPVVADGDDRSLVPAQVCLQPADRLVVQVVRRLVQEQQFRCRGQRGGQGQTGPLAAGQAGQPPSTIQVRKPEPVQGDAHPGVRFVSAPGLVLLDECGVARMRGAGLRFRCCRQVGFRTAHPRFERAQVGQGPVDRVLNGGVGRELQRLGQVSGAAGRHHGQLAALEALLPGDDPQQRGLPRPVVAHDADLLTRFDGEAHPIEYDVVAVSLGEVVECEL